ncbi:type II toxin-antitoxin system YhaV family toxin [Rhizobium sp. LjRoot258]|uniref:type II toxin-antitoxin system YhaV family toxin n=1 Tax=Rhizobium sp. LjRoot258 TaxID=3342299 RepID=UPI003ECC619C
MLVIHGWAILAHPLFLDQLEKLTHAVEALKTKDSEEYQKSANAKLLVVLNQLVFSKIPSDPTSSAYRRGKTLGGDKNRWFRAKFGNGRFRLFFRYNAMARIVIFAWVNDEVTLRTRVSKTDASKVFKGMLDSGNPPDDWAALHKASVADSAVERFHNASSR